MTAVKTHRNPFRRRRKVTRVGNRYGAEVSEREKEREGEREETDCPGEEEEARRAR